jgi:hypothetical protein
VCYILSPLCLILLDENYSIAQSFAVLVTMEDNLAVLLSILCTLLLKKFGIWLQVGPGYVVGPRMELKGEALAKKEKLWTCKGFLCVPAFQVSQLKSIWLNFSSADPQIIWQLWSNVTWRAALSSSRLWLLRMEKLINLIGPLTNFASLIRSAWSMTSSFVSGSAMYELTVNLLFWSPS